MQNLDFGPTHKTGGAKHRINDFCFLKFFFKKFGTLSSEIGPTETKIVKFLQKKAVRVLKTLQMSCALELKPYINNNEYQRKKIRVS